MGLAARPGPTDWLNLGIDGVGGVWFVLFWFPAFRPVIDAVGVKANGLAGGLSGNSRRTAFERGKKIPAPEIVVVK